MVSEPLPSSVAPSKKVICPVGAADVPFKVAVKAIVAPREAGFDELVSAKVGTVTPVPLSGIDWGDPVTLSLKLMAAVAAPDVAGLKWMLTVQESDAAKLVPQLLDATNSLALVPVSPMLLKVSVALPVFVTVTFWTALDDPTV